MSERRRPYSGPVRFLDADGVVRHVAYARNGHVSTTFAATFWIDRLEVQYRSLSIPFYDYGIGWMLPMRVEKGSSYGANDVALAYPDTEPQRCPRCGWAL